MKIKDIKARARKLLLGNYGILIASHFLVDMITTGLAAAAAMIFLGAVSVAISGVGAATAVAAMIFAVLVILGVLVIYFLSLGTTKLYLNFCRRGRASINDLFYAFKRGSHPFKNIAVGLLLFLICLVPGLLIWLLAIIALGLLTNSYTVGAMVGYVLMILYIFYMLLKYMYASVIVIDKPETKIRAALKRSARLTKKRKLRLLWLCTFSFLLWGIPIMLTFGLASLWIEPYISAAFFLFYLRAEEECFPEDSYGEASTEDISGSRASASEDHGAAPSEKASFEAVLKEANIDVTAGAAGAVSNEQTEDVSDVEPSQSSEPNTAGSDTDGEPEAKEEQRPQQEPEVSSQTETRTEAESGGYSEGTETSGTSVLSPENKAVEAPEAETEDKKEEQS